MTLSSILWGYQSENNIESFVSKNNINEEEEEEEEEEKEKNLEGEESDVGLGARKSLSMMEWNLFSESCAMFAS